MQTNPGEIDRGTLERARAMLSELTPLVNDCGLVCGAACCRPDEDGQGGVSLFPGEAQLCDTAGWGHLSRDEALGVPMLLCDGPCPRRARPIACRIFPLTPVRGRDGGWTVRMDARARAVCPLSSSGLKGLNPDFVRAVRSAVRLIAEDAQGEAFLEKWCAQEDEFRKPLW